MIDVIVPNYNGRHHLEICIPSLLRQEGIGDIRILVVDDCSTDDSVAFLNTHYPTVDCLTMPQNAGFVAACNAGIAASTGEFVVLLNNDTEADPHWLANLIGALMAAPEYSFAASKLLLFDRRDTLHAAGDFYRIDGIPGNRGVWQPDGPVYNQQQEVFGPCAGAAAYRRRALDALAVDGNVFDPDLGMYCEDVDLNLRARLHGMRTLYVPTAVVYHRLSATGGGVLASYYCGRNFVLVWLKNMPRAVIRRAWPRMLWQQLVIFGQALWHIRGAAARARLRGQLAVFPALGRFLRKRSAIPAVVDLDRLFLTE